MGRIKAIVKNSNLVYSVYYFLGSLALRFLGLFVRTDKNLVLFVSYGGKKYDDSPKVLYEYIRSRQEYSGLKLVWAFTTPDDYPEDIVKVKIDTLNYYLTALRAGIWITNSSASRGLRFQKKNTKNYQFTHGLTAMKKIGADMKVKKGIHNKHFVETFDAVFIEGKLETEILVGAMKQDRACFVQTGLPRNDDLVGNYMERVNQIREKLRIPEDKKVILYAPTFREWNLDAQKSNTLPIPFDFQECRRNLESEYVLLITAHYEVARYLEDLPEDGFVINAFGYPEINDLLLVADILISDYSSVIFDYSILGRPILCFGYDYDSFVTNRGVYTDLNNIFSHGVIRTQEQLTSVILHMDYESECRFSREQIRDKYLAAYGNAAEKVAMYIWGND